jgi:hypothetical protein
MLVSVLAGYQGGPSYLSLVPVQFCNQNQVPFLSPDGISTWVKGGVSYGTRLEPPLAYGIASNKN